MQDTLSCGVMCGATATQHMTAFQWILTVFIGTILGLVLLFIILTIHDRYENGEWFWTAIIREERRKRQAKVVWYPHVKS